MVDMCGKQKCLPGRGVWEVRTAGSGGSTKGQDMGRLSSDGRVGWYDAHRNPVPSNSDSTSASHIHNHHSEPGPCRLQPTFYTLLSKDIMYSRRILRPARSGSHMLAINYLPPERPQAPLRMRHPAGQVHNNSFSYAPST